MNTIAAKDITPGTRVAVFGHFHEVQSVTINKWGRAEITYTTNVTDVVTATSLVEVAA